MINKEHLGGLKSEIMAGCVLFVKDEADRAWNTACQRAVKLIEAYEHGNGLFQQPVAKEGSGDEEE